MENNTGNPGEDTQYEDSRDVMAWEEDIWATIEEPKMTFKEWGEMLLWEVNYE